MFKRSNKWSFYQKMMEDCKNIRKRGSQTHSFHSIILKFYVKGDIEKKRKKIRSPLY